MLYKKASNQIEILIDENETIERVLETIASVSYKLATPMRFDSDYTKNVEDVDFSKLITVEKEGETNYVMLNLDNVNGRQYNTVINNSKEGKIMFNSSLFESERIDAVLFLSVVNKVLMGYNAETSDY